MRHALATHGHAQVPQALGRMLQLAAASLDRYGLRAVLAEHGVEYLDYQAYLAVPQ